MNQGRILVVEDEGIVAEDLRITLEDMGHLVVGVVDTASAALISAERGQPDIVLMDITLKGQTDGVDAAIELKRRMDVAIIFLTAYSTEEVLQRAQQIEPVGYIIKPYDETELAGAIELALGA